MRHFHDVFRSVFVISTVVVHSEEKFRHRLELEFNSSICQSLTEWHWNALQPLWTSASSKCKWETISTSYSTTWITLQENIWAGTWRTHVHQTVVPRLLGRSRGKESVCLCRRCKRCKLSTWAGKTPWRCKWQPTPVFLTGKSHGQRRLADYSPEGHRLYMTEWLSTSFLYELRYPRWNSQGKKLIEKGLP